jgi:hypothetical protein
VLHPERLWLLPVGIGFALASVVSISPPVLGRFLSLVRRLKNRGGEEQAAVHLDHGTIGRGWLLMTVGWFLVGASMWAVMRAVPGPEASSGHFWLALESVTLSVVVGIASLIPGGLGVRELVIVPLLTTEFGAAKALACAVLIRIVWLIAEVGIAVIIQWVSRKRVGGSAGT